MKIIIVDDQKLLRDCLKYMIELNSDFDVVANASNGNEAIDLCKKYSPDVVLMDIIMPECNGIEATRQIKEIDSKIKILVLTTSFDNEDIARAIEMGADGYVLKDISAEDLIVAIESVAAGLAIIQAGVYEIAANKTNHLLAGVNTKKNLVIEGVTVELSERELMIVKLIVEGKKTSEIAEKYFIAEGRVRNIITEIISKLMLRDRTQLAVFAIKNNLV